MITMRFKMPYNKPNNRDVIAVLMLLLVGTLLGAWLRGIAIVIITLALLATGFWPYLQEHKKGHLKMPHEEPKEG